MWGTRPAFGNQPTPFGGNMHRRLLAIAVVILAGWSTTGIAANPDESSTLFKVREAVWRSWFANDAKTLRELVPPETIVISAGEKQWKHQAAVLQSAAGFHAQGGKLIRLEFPRTEIQQFGEVAILYSEYRLETEMHGKHSVSSGRATEIFVRHNGQWTNPGWHTDAEK
jgi:ketosteroid isomerase-like protein